MSHDAPPGIGYGVVWTVGQTKQAWEQKQDWSPILDEVIAAGGVSPPDPVTTDDSPFPTPHLHTITSSIQSFANDGLFFFKANGDMTFFWHQAGQHQVNWTTTAQPASLVAVDSYDRGLRLTNQRTIYLNTDNAGPDYRNLVGAVMDDGSWRVMTCTRTASSPWQPPTLWSSTDEGVTWTSSATTIGASLPAGLLVVPYAEMYPWPDASNNSNGRRIVYGYDGTGRIAYTTTADNGATWSAWELAGNSASVSPTNEFVRMRAGIENKWVFFLRYEAGVSYLGFSTDQVTITDFVASPVSIKANGPSACQEVDSNIAWLFSASRHSQVIDGTSSNYLVMMRLDVEEIFDTNGVSGFSYWRSIAVLPQWETGYVYSLQKVNGEWCATVMCGEPYQGGHTTGRGGNSLMWLGNTPTGVSHPYGIATSTVHPNYIANGDARIWTVPSPITPGLTRLTAGDNCGAMRNNGVAGSTFSQIARGRRMQRNVGDTATNALNMVLMMDPNDVVNLRGKLMTFMWSAAAGANFSAATGILSCYIFANPTNSAITSTDGSKTGNVSIGNPDNDPIVCFLDPATGYFKDFRNIVQIPMDASMVYLRFNWTPVGTAGANDYCDVIEVRGVVGPDGGVYAPMDYADEVQRCVTMAKYAYWAGDRGPSPVALTTDVTGILPVANGGTGLASGTSGGVLAYTASGTLASSGALTLHGIVVGGGAGAAPSALASLGTATQVLHGNPSGYPTWGPVSLTTDVSGTLPLGNGGTGGTSALTAQQSLFTESVWASRPAAAGNTGRRIFVSDIGIGGSLWISDGTRWLPVFPILLSRGAAQTPPGGLTGTAAETAAVTYTLAADAMGINGSIFAYFTGYNNNNANTKTYRLRFGGMSGTAHVAVINTTNIGTSPIRTIANDSSASSQKSQTGNYSGVGGTTTALVTGAIDTTAAVDIVITLQLGNSGDNISLEMWEIWLRP